MTHHPLTWRIHESQLTALRMLFIKIFKAKAIMSTTQKFKEVFLFFFHQKLIFVINLFVLFCFCLVVLSFVVYQAISTAVSYFLLIDGIQLHILTTEI